MTLGELKKTIDEMAETLGHNTEIKLETGNYICEMREAYAVIPENKGKYIVLSEHLEEFKKFHKKRKGPQKF